MEKNNLSVNEVVQRLHLDSGTLTPLLRRLEQKQLLKRERVTDDERRATVILSDKGSALQQQTKDTPEKMTECLLMSEQEVSVLHNVLNRLIKNH